MKQVYLVRPGGRYDSTYSAAFMSRENALTTARALGADEYGIKAVPVIDAPTDIKGALGTALEMDEWRGGEDDGE